nr:helix-turn-helix domain-containing protein [Stomatobaculum longum]
MLSTLSCICGVLSCDFSDILEIIPDETTESEDKVNG